MHTRRDAVALGTATLVAGSCFFGEAFFVGEARAQGANERPREGDVFVSVEGGADAVPIEPKDIVSGAPILAWPLDPAARIVRNGSRLNKVLLLRLDPSDLTAATRDRAADGIVAYTAICPHTGCDVTGWIADQAILECPCHSSLYNPRDGGAVIGGRRRVPCRRCHSSSRMAKLLSRGRSPVASDLRRVDNKFS